MNLENLTHLLLTLAVVVPLACIVQLPDFLTLVCLWFASSTIIFACGCYGYFTNQGFLFGLTRQKLESESTSEDLFGVSKQKFERDTSCGSTSAGSDGSISETSDVGEDFGTQVAYSSDVGEDGIQVAYSSEICRMTFRQSGGPQHCGLLELTCIHGPTLTVENLAPILLTLSAWIDQGIIADDFVSIFNISCLKLPSIFRVYGLIEEFKNHLPSLGRAFRIFQQSFAVIRGDSKLFNMAIDGAVTVSGAGTKPIFESDKETCLACLAMRLEDARSE